MVTGTEWYEWHLLASSLMILFFASQCRTVFMVHCYHVIAPVLPLEQIPGSRCQMGSCRLICPTLPGSPSQQWMERKDFFRETKFEEIGTFPQLPGYQCSPAFAKMCSYFHGIQKRNTACQDFIYFTEHSDDLPLTVCSAVAGYLSTFIAYFWWLGRRAMSYIMTTSSVLHVDRGLTEQLAVASGI